ncbi:MAG: substrate-binding domain-containing protein [Kiritimatiellae bacterium]|nr:substrate-binding domain-containing protein [Kiritimatiellia bacterium]
MSKEHPVLSGKHKKVAFITDATDTTSYTPRILSGIAEYMQKRCGFVLQNISFTEIISDSLNRRFDGIIINLCAENTRKLLNTLNGTKLPIVDTSAEVEDPALIRVDIDLVREGTMAAEWFLRRGFRNLAYCGFHGVATYPFSDILEGAFAAVAKRADCQYMTFNMPPVTGKDKQYIRIVQRALDKWVATLPPRTAVFCIQDRRAVMLTQACLTCGRAVPDDIAIMGRTNDITTCVCASVPISSIDENLEGQGYAAMRILAEAIEHPVAPKLRPVFRVPPLGIVERESTVVYPVDPPFLAKALLLLDENMEHPVSATELAKEVGVSSTTLRTAFRKVLGTSLGKYALSVRMREAKRLMMEERFSVKEIATKMGFSSQAYFSAAYRAFYGHPPSADRHH